MSVTKMSVLLAVLVAVFVWLPPLEVLFGALPAGWSPATRTSFGSQVTGFVILGLTMANFALLLRTRLGLLGGHYLQWRTAHTVMGFGLLLALMVHTGGMHIGTHLSQFLMATFVGVLTLGALSSMVKTINTSLCAKQAPLHHACTPCCCGQCPCSWLFTSFPSITSKPCRDNHASPLE